MAQGFARLLGKEKFNFLLLFLHKIFLQISLLSAALQKVELTVLPALQRIADLKVQLTHMNTDSFFEEIRRDMSLLNIPEPQSKRLRLSETEDESYRSLQSNILSRMLECIDNRFSTLKQLEFISLVCVQRFSEYRENFPESLFRSLFASPYSNFFDERDLRVELTLLYSDKLLSKCSGDTGDLLKAMATQGIKQSLDQVVRLIELILTLPLTTSSVERSFSALKRIKSSARKKLPISD